MRHAHLFDTPLGVCGLAWTDVGVCAFQLPDSSPDSTRARLLRTPDTVEVDAIAPHIAALLTRVRAVLSGQHDDLRDVTLDLSDVPPFDRAVYAVARTIGPGDTLTYGEVARRLGDPGAARAVGGALGRNPIPLIVPCHRVLAAGGKSGGFSAGGGVATKERMLAIERGQPGLW